MTNWDVVNFEQLQQTIDNFARNLGNGLWFRGHANADWSLLPFVFRNSTEVPKPDICEAELLKKFRARAFALERSLPEFGDHFAWLSLARHHGVPTRLLDWTESLFVATYFAVDPNLGDADVDAAIWALNPRRLNRHCFNVNYQGQGIFDQSDKRVAENSDRAFRGERSGHSLAVIAPDTSLRMLAQQAAYTIHGSELPLDKHPKADQFLAKLTIKASFRGTLKKFCDQMGIKRHTLFPGLDTLSMHICDSTSITVSDDIGRDQ